jgi:hypothetical protein
MIFLTALMCVLLGYQVSMPAVDNAKYTFTSHNDNIIRMNTQNGTMEKCDASFKCEKVTKETTE